MTRLRLTVGDEVRWDGRTWNVAVLEGASARLLEAGTGAVAAVSLPHLVTDPGFEVVGADRPVVAPLALLDALPDHVRDQALAWERHVREVESGITEPGGEAPRPQYDPATRTMAQREAAKAAELTGAGVPTSVATVRRMRARYRERGVWGLVDQRTTRPRSPVGRADPRVVEAVKAVLEEQRGRSTGTLSALRDRVRWLLEDLYGPGVVAVPPQSTFNRLVHALGDGQGVLGSAVQRRWHAARPEPPFGATVALRPGELVMMDSTPLDVLAVMADGVVGRPELTIAIDVATRAICAAVLRPPGSSTVDAAVLLAEMVAPMRMRLGWDAVLAMQRSVVPYERLLSLDERLEGAAARPVIVPETVVVDQGRVFVSASFLAACESLGVSLQPVPPANGPAKGHVERTFKSINHGFCQYVAGYTGSNTTERGSGVEEEACWTLPQLQDFLDEWLVAGWHARKHSALRHPLLPHLALSPIEMWAALVGVTGYVPVPPTSDSHIELLPVRWQVINDYGIRFDYRTYDSKALNGFRRRTVYGTGEAQRWEVHYNPYDPARIWVRLPKGFVEVPWIHATEVSLPFTDYTWRHVRATVARASDRDAHELALARALDALLRRAGAGVGTRRERTLAARAAAGQAVALRRPDPSDVDVPSDVAPPVQARPPGEQPAEPDEDLVLGFDEGEDEDEDDGEDALGAATAQVPSARVSRLLNPHEEAARWL
ncbi:Mu transposase C-terminal domain-containing protein [Kitasatospora sp. NPDC127059]|uniref:Mu transposase C-terminal domain-containing protein n=1 Tax=unclassified Kitasatospora TaxID=2633591 RepID=UPI003653A7FE